MELTVSLTRLKSSKLTPNQYAMLVLLYNKMYDDIAEIFGKSEALNIRNSLIGTEFILSDLTTKFTETVLSKNHVEKLLGIRSDAINFWEFYNCYPIKVDSRILRASGPTSQMALKHEKKYLARVKRHSEHVKAIKAVEAFVARKKKVGELKFLPAMEVVLNNCLWEQWENFVVPEGDEEKVWNMDTI
jgi:hypothetical protein